MNSLKEDKNKGLSHYRDVINKYHAEDLDFNLGNGYILQATRNGFYYLEDSENIAIITKRGANQYIVVSCVGKNRDDFILDTSKALYAESKIPVIIKNIELPHIQDLLDKGFREYTSDESWDENAKYDDNTFPEQVLKVSTLQKLEGPQFQSLREEMNRVQRDFSYEVISREMVSSEDIQEVFEKWMENMNTRNDIERKQLYESTFMFADLTGFGLFHYIIKEKETGIAIGWLVLSEISSACLGFNVLVNDFSYRNSYRAFMLEGVRIAKERGYKYLNIQGSEDEDQYLSKRRLHADIEIHKKHLVFTG